MLFSQNPPAHKVASFKHNRFESVPNPKLKNECATVETMLKFCWALTSEHPAS